MTAIGFALFVVGWFGLYVASQLKMPFWLEAWFSVFLLGGSFNVAAGVTQLLWRYAP